MRNYPAYTQHSTDHFNIRKKIPFGRIPTGFFASNDRYVKTNKLYDHHHVTRRAVVALVLLINASRSLTIPLTLLHLPQGLVFCHMVLVMVFKENISRLGP